MSDLMVSWVKGHRAACVLNINALRSGNLATSELRDGKRVNTTLETIAEGKRALAELDAVIERQAADEK